MQRCVPALLGLFLLLIQGFVYAASPLFLPMQTAKEFTQRMDVVDPHIGEQVVQLQGKGTVLSIDYSASAPMDVIVSFPTSSPSDAGNTADWNPLNDLRAQLPAGTDRAVQIDMTVSPAWAPSRNEYVVALQAPEGTELTLHGMSIGEKPSIVQSIAIAHRQFFMDEPPLPSSIVFLYGFTVFGSSVTLMGGLLVLLGGVIIVFIGVRRFFLLFLGLVAAIVVLYDLRFALNSAHVVAEDYSQWRKGQYRQLEALPSIADTLEALHAGEQVTVCSDDTNLLFRWLRYRLYPTDVTMAEDGWNSASYAVIISSSRGSLKDGLASCGTLPQRPAERIEQFPGDALLLRFRSS